MKKIFCLFIAVILTLTYVHAQTDWVTHKADNNVSVKFPSEPKEIMPGTVMVTGKDSIAYVFTVVDFVKVAGIDSAALAPMKATPQFAAQLKTGMNKSLPDVTLDDFKIGTWNGFTSYTSSGFDSKKQRYDIFMFIVGSKLYSLSTIIADGISTADRDIFFASASLTK